MGQGGGTGLLSNLYGTVQGPANANNPDVQLANQLKAGLSSGSLTPAQAQQMIQNSLNTSLNTRPLGNDYANMTPQQIQQMNQPSITQALNTTFSPFEQYYNQVYSPLAQDVVGNQIQQLNPSGGLASAGPGTNAGPGAPINNPFGTVMGP